MAPLRLDARNLGKLRAMRVDEVEMDADPGFDRFVYDPSGSVRQRYEDYAAALGRACWPSTNWTIR